MKNRPSFILAFLAIAAIACTSSCVKTYTCHCTIVYTGNPGLPDTTVQEYTIKDTKAVAANKCLNASGSYSNTGNPENGTINTTENCYIY